MTSSDNFEDYLKATGVALAARTLAASSKPTETFTDAGDGTWTYRSVTAFATLDLAFTLGQAFTEEPSAGRTCTTAFTADGNKFMQVQIFDTVTATITRTFIDDGLNTSFEAADTVATRSYKRI